MRQIPDVPVLPCSKCGSTDWATTDKFVVRRDEPQQSASEDARATPPAEPSSWPRATRSEASAGPTCTGHTGSGRRALL